MPPTPNVRSLQTARFLIGRMENKVHSLFSKICFVRTISLIALVSAPCGRRKGHHTAPSDDGACAPPAVSVSYCFPSQGWDPHNVDCHFTLFVPLTVVVHPSLAPTPERQAAPSANCPLHVPFLQAIKCAASPHVWSPVDPIPSAQQFF